MVVQAGDACGTLQKEKQRFLEQSDMTDLLELMELFYIYAVQCGQATCS